MDSGSSHSASGPPARASPLSLLVGDKSRSFALVPELSDSPQSLRPLFPSFSSLSLLFSLSRRLRCLGVLNRRLIVSALLPIYLNRLLNNTDKNDYRKMPYSPSVLLLFFSPHSSLSLMLTLESPPLIPLIQFGFTVPPKKTSRRPSFERQTRQKSETYREWTLLHFVEGKKIYGKVCR